MNERVPLSRFMPYGAPDLLVAARPDMARALALASTTIVLAFALLGGLQLAHPTHGVVPPPPIWIVPPPAPPPLEQVRVPAPAGPPPTVVSSTVGQVVPDEQAPAEVTFAMPDALGPGDPDGTIENGSGVSLDPAPAETLPALGAWQALEQLPRAIRIVRAEYPDMARSALVEGWVVVHVLVGRDGRIVDVRLDEQRHVPMLDPAALDAARSFMFEPATMNGHPVAAWVAVPFHFTLH